MNVNKKQKPQSKYTPKIDTATNCDSQRIGNRGVRILPDYQLQNRLDEKQQKLLQRAMEIAIINYSKQW